MRKEEQSVNYVSLFSEMIIEGLKKGNILNFIASLSSILTCWYKSELDIFSMGMPSM